jgi:hypothetical protein
MNLRGVMVVWKIPWELRRAAFGWSLESKQLEPAHVEI